MSSAIQELCRTFDVNVLSSLSHEDIQKILTYAEKNKYNKNSPIVKTLLTMIINRYTIVPTISADIVEGPISFSEHKLDDMHIYIFGDLHVQYDECKKLHKKLYTMGVDVYIHSTVYTSYKFIDIFLEHPYQVSTERKARFGNQLYLSKVSSKFDGCLQRIKNCPIHNARVHYADVRHNLDTEFHKYIDRHNIIVILIESILHGTADYVVMGVIGTEEVTEQLVIQTLIDTFNEILSMDVVKKYKTYDKVWKHLSENFMKSLKITKQFENVENGYIRNILTSMMDECLVDLPSYNIVSGFKNVIDDFKKGNTNITELSYIAFDISLRALKISSCYMDGYLLGRLFRSYTNKKGEYSKSAKNIIIYAGDNHAINYRRILAKVGFVPIHNIIAKDNTQCIDMRKVKQPLFSD